MNEDKKFNEVYNIVENIEVNSRVREIRGNKEKLEGYWKIGKILIDVQQGKRAEYGKNIIKEWSNKLTEIFGKFYSEANLRYMRLFYQKFDNQICHALRDESLKASEKIPINTNLTWTHYKIILPIKNENKRNYYINQIILNNLSSRELISRIKSKAYERLSYADKENIKLIENDNYNLTIEDMIKDPIILKTSNISKFNELAIHKLIIKMLEEKFLELGTGFALIGHEYKINIGDRTYKIDLLFFNYELNCFIVMEIKINENKPEDIGQLELYVNHIDKSLKKNTHNKTIGVLLVKKENKILVEYITNPNIYLTSYKLEKEVEI